MITAMVAGYYEPNGNEVYPPGADAYGEYCYSVQDMCNPCNFHGPQGVRMVQNNGSGHVPVQMSVPPGHIVHQVVDENGTVRHVLYPAIPAMPHYNPNHASNGPLAAQYFSYPAYGHPQFQPATHPALSPQGIAAVLPQPPHCNGDATPQDLDVSPPPSQVFPSPKEESYPSPTYKFRRKTDNKKPTILPKQTNGISRKNQKFYNCDEPYPMSGSSASASGSNASEDEDFTWITEYLSNLRPPTVNEVSPYSVMVRWKPPDSPEGDFELSPSKQQSEIMYEVLLCENSDGRFKSVYSGVDHHCNISSLKPGTEYFVCVQALMDDIRGSGVKGIAFKTPSVEPEAPQPPRLSARTKSSLTLRWNSKSDPSSPTSKINYILDYDEGCNKNSFVNIYTGPLKQYKVTKLTPATGYKFRLAAMNDNGKSKYSDTCCYFTYGHIPSQPLPPVLKKSHANRLQLEWARRMYDEDFVLQMEDEKIRHGFLTVYTGRDTQYVCSSLRENTEYKFRLSANNEEGSSPWSRILSYRTLAEKKSSKPIPGKPVAKGRIHASCFRVTWDPPKDTKHSSIAKYILEVERGSAFEAVYTGPDTEFFLENLLPGTTYKLRVYCITAEGHSPFSEVSGITTAAVSPGKCALPKLQSKPEATFVCLDWAHPEHDGGSAVAEYEVDMTSLDNVTIQVYKGPETSCIANGLLPGRPYLFQVRAYNRIGAGPFSEPLEVVSGAGPPDSPRNATINCDSPFGCQVLWEEPMNNGATITNYQLQWNTEEDEETYTELYEGLSLSYDVKELVPATSYYFKVRAINEAGPGSFTDAIMCTTLSACPGLITNVSVLARSTAILISWSGPTCHGSAINSYNVELDDALYSVEASAQELCIEELVPETSYRIRVQAINELGAGEFSQPIHVETLKLPPLPPCLECILVNHNFLRLKWGDKKEDDSISYTVEMSSRSKSFTSVYHGSSLSCKVSRLQENSPFNFRIFASNASGQGPYSPIQTFYTSRAPPPVLKAPRIINVTENSCQVEWSGIKPAGNCTSYQLQLISGSSDVGVTVYQGPETRYTIHDLSPSMPYSLRVTAIRFDLSGSPSVPVAFTTSAAETDATSPQQLMPCTSALSHVERRTAADRHLAVGLVVGFEALGILLGILAEHVFGPMASRDW